MYKYANVVNGWPGISYLPLKKKVFTNICSTGIVYIIAFWGEMILCGQFVPAGEEKVWVCL